MSKVVIFNGSPRKDGNTATILQMIERGAKEHHATVKVYNLFKLRMSACQGCFGCRMQDDCVINDEMKKAIDDIKDADAVVIGSPVYFMQINGMVKNLYDRLFPLMGVDGTPRYGQKKIVTVYTQGGEDPTMFETYFDFLAQTAFPSFGFVDEHRIICPCATNPETAENNRELKQSAYDVGIALAKL